MSAKYPGDSWPACTTMKIAAGNTGFTSRSTRSRAEIAPADPPSTIMSLPSGMAHLATKFCSGLLLRSLRVFPRLLLDGPINDSRGTHALLSHLRTAFYSAEYRKYSALRG